MTTRKSAAKKQAKASKADDTLHVAAKPTEAEHKATARALIAPAFRHGQAAAQLLKANLGDTAIAPGAGDYADAINDLADMAESGDLKFASRLLAAQALTLDGIFTEMARRMALNMGDYLGATETYARIALKAQAGSRATLAELAKLHQPREQTVRHVHVYEGGQAVIADQFHSHTGGQENGQTDKRPHAKGAPSTALPCPDSFGATVPIPCGKGEPKMQDARGQGQRGT